MIAKKCMKKWNSALDFLKKYKCNKIKQVPYQSNCNESPNAISFLFVFQLLCFEFPFFFSWTEFFLKYISSIDRVQPRALLLDIRRKFVMILTLILAFSSFKFLLSSLTLLWCFWSIWRAWLSVIRFCVRFWGGRSSDLSSLNTGRTNRRWVTCSGE